MTEKTIKILSIATTAVAVTTSIVTTWLSDKSLNIKIDKAVEAALNAKKE